MSKNIDLGNPSKGSKNIMTEEQQIQIKTLEGVIEDIKLMNPTYIVEFLEEQIDIIKHGI
tara:strand:+ start:682 stop:861 length:180 start_codon:yes stop_codon:yes gene_type:complete